MAYAGKLITFNFNKCNTEINNYDNLDKNILQETLNNFNCNTQTVYENLSLEELKQVTACIERTDFSSCKYFCAAILTNGGRIEALQSDERFININTQIILPLLRNKSLKNTPKIFFIDSCKEAFDIISQDTDARPFYEFHNLIRCYAATEDSKVYADKDGSYFVQNICKTMQKFGAVKSVEDCMRQTVDIVLKKSRQLQEPCFISNMTVPFILGTYSGKK